MYNFLLTTHYYLMVILLALLLFTVGRFFMNMRNDQPFTEFERKQSLLVMILTHVQLLLGLVIFFTGPALDLFSDMSSLMGNARYRLKFMEHPLTMIIAVALITIGHSRAKKMTDSKAKFKQIVIFYGIGLVLMAIRIPWKYISHG